MDFLTMAKQRCSMRSYLEREVERETLDLILEAAHVAPTAANLQPVRLLVVRSPEGRAKLQDCAELYGAPLAIVACADRRKAWTRPFDGKQTGDIDAAILTDHMMLQATALGLGSVWIAFFDPKKVQAAFHLPPEVEPVSILALGYAAAPPAAPDRHTTQRLPLSAVVAYEDGQQW